MPLVEEYIIQQRTELTFKSVRSYILYLAMKDGQIATSNTIYESNKLQPEGCEGVKKVLQQLVCEGLIAVVPEGEYKKINV